MSATNKVPPRRVTAVIDEDMFMQIKHWASEHGISVNEYIRNAVLQTIHRECNPEYDTKDLMVNRMNQLIEIVCTLSENVQSLEKTTTSGIGMMTQVMRGGNYLQGGDDE